MARKSKLESIGIAILAGVALVVAGVEKFFETFGVLLPAIILLGVICLYFWSKHQKEKSRLAALKKRRENLLEKYKDSEVVDNILNQTIWVGQTNEQLHESLGAPEDIDQKVLKTKKKEIWKYGHKGGNRYMYRITLDNDEVVGWDEKA